METIETNIIENFISPINYVNSPPCVIHLKKLNILILEQVMEYNTLSEYLIDTNISVTNINFSGKQTDMSVDISYKPL